MLEKNIYMDKAGSCDYVVAHFRTNTFNKLLFFVHIIAASASLYNPIGFPHIATLSPFRL